MTPPKLPDEHREELLHALRTGIPPTRALHHLQVGRDLECKSLLASLKLAMAGGYAFRVITGSYGSGKSFIIELMRAIARSEKANMASMRAELTPDRRLVGSTGQATDLWRDLVRSLTAGDTGEPGTGQLRVMLEALVVRTGELAAQRRQPQAPIIDELLASLENHGGHAMADVCRAYWQANVGGDEARMRGCVRWIAAGFDRKADAKHASGVAYAEIGLVDRLRYLAALARAAGWSGLFVCIDEMDKLNTIAHKGCRSTNLQEVLRLANLGLEPGAAPGLAVFLSGAHGFVDDSNCGAASIEPLHRRLSRNKWVDADAGQPLHDHFGTVIRLTNLSRGDTARLLHKIRDIYFINAQAPHRLPDDGIAAYIARLDSFVGADTHLKPSETVREFVGFLDVLDQNPGISWQALLGKVRPSRDRGPRTGLAGSTRANSDDDEALN
ncbi:MAG: BREX system ATP-binding domain-containing protein [Myxococcota bacterium]